MRSFIGALVLLLVLATTVAAAELVPLDTTRTPELAFNAKVLGSSPASGMVCVHGHCRNGLDPAQRPVLLPFSTYEYPGDPLRFAGLTIESPRYTYWEDRLFRVAFRVDCASGNVEDCLDSLAAELDSRYRLTPVDVLDSSRPQNHMTRLTRRYVTRSGAMVMITANRDGAVWEMPKVWIVDQGGLDRVALASNPKYKVRSILVPADYAAR